MPYGHCFHTVMQAVISGDKNLPYLDDFDSVFVIHGTARVKDANTGQYKRGGHAWVELNTQDYSLIWEPESKTLYGKDFFLNNADAKEDYRLTVKDLAILCVKTKTSGPFTIDERKLIEQ